MRSALALAATCLTLAATAVGAAVQSPHPVPSSAVGTEAQKLDAGVVRHTAEVQHLQRAVSAQEARREEAQRRLQQQDREIQSLQRQLQTAGRHDSLQPH